MIDIHLVDGRQIEIVLNHRLGDMTGKVRMALDRRHRARSPPFVGGMERRRAADREGRNKLEAERVRMVVIDQENDVRLVLRHPFLGELVALE